MRKLKDDELMQENKIYYKGEDGLLVSIDIDSIDIDEDNDMLYFSYNILEGDILPEGELGPILGKYLTDLISEYVKTIK